MIVMSNLVFSERYTPLREFLTKKFGMRFISGYAKRPSSLFVGVQVRNAIFIGTKGEKSLFSAPMKRWTKEFRPHLMPSVMYTEVSRKADAIQIWPFITSSRIADLLTSFSGTFKQDVISRGPEYDLATGTPVWNKSETNATPLFYSGTAYNWISCFKIPPPAEDGQGKPVVSSTLSVIWFKNEETRDIAFTLFVSKWMFAWWCIYGDDFHVTKEILSSFPINFSTISVEKKKKLLSLSEELQTKMMQKVRWQQVTFPDKRVIKVGNWDLEACKQTLEDIDEIWTEILNATSLKDELRFQYFSSVKTVQEDNEVEPALAD